jgi:hypothetical protein
MNFALWLPVLFFLGLGAMSLFIVAMAWVDALVSATKPEAAQRRESGRMAA